MELTEMGRQMAVLPLEPELARALLASKEHQCTSEVLDLVSLLSTSGKVLYDVSPEQREAASDARNKFRDPSGDHGTLLRAYAAYADILESEPPPSVAEKHSWCRANFLNERALEEARRIRSQLSDACKPLGLDPSVSCGQDVDRILRAVVQGFVTNLASIQPDGTYRQLMGRSVRFIVADICAHS
jgi:HrpA-like RNA helicase